MNSQYETEYNELKWGPCKAFGFVGRGETYEVFIRKNHCILRRTRKMEANDSLTNLDLSGSL